MKVAQKGNGHIETGHGILLAFILAVIPLLTMVGVYRSGIGDYPWASGHSFYDFFLVYKSWLLMVSGVVVLLLTAILLYEGKMGQWRERKQWRCLVPAGLFLFLSIISALAAEERTDALFGGYEQMEGLLVVVAYIACFSFVFLFAADERLVHMLLHSLVAGSLILSLLGALQAFGIDYLTSKMTFPFFTMFMNRLPDTFTGISASFGKGVSYATLYNPNYVGTYVALVLPVTVLLGIWEKKRIFQIMAAASSIFQIIMLIGAQSMTGLIGVAGGAFVALVFLFADVRKNRWVLLGIGVAGAALVTGVFLFVPGVLSRFTSSTISSCSYRISSMVSSSDALRMELDSGRTVTLQWKPEGTVYEFDAIDDQGKKIELKGDSFSGVQLAGAAYQGIELTATKKQLTLEEETTYYDVLRITAEEKYFWDFVKKDGRLWYVNRTGKLDQMRKVETFGFDRQYDLATNRGYIWSRTLPLLKKTILLGVGQDNFVYAFPNDDYVGKVNCGFDGQIITKPHNMYLQIWVQDGMFACLSFLALYLIIVIKTFRRCFRRGKLTYSEKVNVALVCGITGYMAAGLANDSTICVAPVFWILLGLGYAVNRN